MASSAIYPLKFVPILKERIWGGTNLVAELNKRGDGKLGESWEISGVENNVSQVENGYLRGMGLRKVIEKFGASLVGNKVYKSFGTEFPLLFKFIDAGEDLSVQLHPNDNLASSRHDSFGKTEMWYIIKAEEGARLILGFQPGTNKDTYSTHLAENKLTEILHRQRVEAGESYFIESGTVHAIGGGILLAEIQQTSDITYRVFDWNRPGLDGKMRELHTELALDAINFNAPDTRLNYQDSWDEPVMLCSSPYFETRKLMLTANYTHHLITRDSFTVLMCISGNAILKTLDSEVPVSKGETVLIPADLTMVLLKTTGATFLDICVP